MTSSLTYLQFTYLHMFLPLYIKSNREQNTPYFSLLADMHLDAVPLCSNVIKTAINSVAISLCFYLALPRLKRKRFSEFCKMNCAQHMADLRYIFIRLVKLEITINNHVIIWEHQCLWKDANAVPPSIDAQIRYRVPKNSINYGHIVGIFVGAQPLPLRV